MTTPPQELPVPTIRRYEPGDETSMLELFNLVFSEVVPDFQPRSMEMMRWEYLDNPAGQRMIVAALPDGQIVGHFGGVPVRVQIEERVTTMTQIVDSMIHPSYRAHSMQPGLFVRLGNRWIEEYFDDDHDVMNYGIPIPVAYRIGREYLRYETIRELLYLIHDEHSNPLPAAPEDIEVVETDRVGEWIELLWKPYMETVAMAAVRDATFLNWRFADKPDREFRFYLARTKDKEDLRGLLVYCTSEVEGKIAGVFADWMVRYDDLGAGLALLHAAQAQTQRDEAVQLMGTFPSSCPWFDKLQAWGFRVKVAPWNIVARNRLRPYDILWLRDHWYYTLAETDLV
ncbi:MAG: GNAT family N-acetyltransferase [Planctomycetes bacterium]|nr:GNAT family N-acetyltransferase [Planctomycetota bacterium]